ncbi:MAG: ATP-binding protein [Burkholderiaceae bacterium]|nr:ATP-binding protein [Burkholderiaceae bacterium]
MTDARLETAGAAPEPPWRTLQYFALARVLVASSLLLSVAAVGGSLTGAETGDGTLALAVGYFTVASALALLALYLRRQFGLQLAGQLGTDLLFITVLIVAAGGLRGGIMVLYLLPLAGASLLLPTVPAFFVCAMAVLALLGDALLRVIAGEGSESSLFQTGLYGAALFAITGLLRLLSARLATQERLALARGRDLQNQLEINRLVIAQMEQGVLVVDADTRVRANNRAARQMLGLPANAQLTGRKLLELDAVRPLAEAFLRWREAERATGSWSNTVMQPIVPGQHAMPELQLRARFARPPTEAGDEFVVFLEDVRAVEERAQQLKLAAMGRLTASIAHEIRNPLAAISHAGQLLAEDASEPLQQRLSGIVRENTQRLNRLVEDVLRVARREAPLGDDIDLGAFVRDWLAEFERDRALHPGLVELRAEPGLTVKFELSHLRQVLFNLVDNALRFGSGKRGAVQIVVEQAVDDGGRVRLWVFDDGAGIAPEAQHTMFEPFFTTRAGGTGLGLYIAREFCVANRCELAFTGRRELDGSSRDGFVMRFARRATTGSEDVGFLDTIPVQ